MSTTKAIYLVLAAMAGCSSGASHQRPLVQGAPPTESATAIAGPIAEPTELAPSIYELPIELRDARNVAVGLDVSRGHPVLISMFYASCPVACPVLIEEIKQIAGELPAAMQHELRVVLVSFDPVRDTPASLHELVEARGLDERWTVAAASESDARTLAAVLGIKYRKLDNGEYFHSSTIVALDAQGRPIARTDVLGKRDELVAALR
jgi:protein SCO1/2